MFALIEYTKHDKLKKHRNTQNTNFKCTGLRRSLHAALTMLNMYFNLSWLFKNYLSILVCRRPKIIWSVKLIQRYISLEQVYFKIVIFLFERVFLLSLIEQKYHNMAMYWSVGDWFICCRMFDNISACKRFIQLSQRNACRGYAAMTQLLLWKIEEDIMLKLSFIFSFR